MALLAHWSSQLWQAKRQNSGMTWLDHGDALKNNCLVLSHQPPSFLLCNPSGSQTMLHNKLSIARLLSSTEYLPLVHIPSSPAMLVHSLNFVYLLLFVIKCYLKRRNIAQQLQENLSVPCIIYQLYLVNNLKQTKRNKVLKNLTYLLLAVALLL